MSVYQRFYVKTNNPRQVEQLIIATLGGSAWLEPNDSGDFLHRVSVIREDQHSIQPARDIFRNLVDLDARPRRAERSCWSAVTQLWRRSANTAPAADTDTHIAKWYWLPSIVDYGSVEAAQLAQALYQSPLVDVVAEDNEISGDGDDASATVINLGHHLLNTPVS